MTSLNMESQDEVFFDPKILPMEYDSMKKKDKEDMK
jgi:hypothetical protein